MQERCLNRLTVLGSKEAVERILRSGWERRSAGRYFEWLENFPRRVVCTFETDEPPLESLRRLSRRRPELVLLLDYEVERQRIKGLVKTQGGKITRFEIEL
jgi:hypothetical protein